jgi:membrane protease YdiL (CAAX protease family)
LLLLTAVVCVGMQSTSEEIVFRRYLLPRLAVRQGPLLALLLTTAMFTVVPVGSGGWGGLGVMLMGIALGLSAWRTGWLMPAVGLHVANNLFRFLYDPHGTNADAGPLDVALSAGSLALWWAWVEFGVSRAARAAR